MTDATDHNHDLEDHLPTLRKLDEARKRIGELRDEGIKVLILDVQVFKLRKMAENRVS
jgi:hypothetical protein